jgi:hypothetical protein
MFWKYAQLDAQEYELSGDDALDAHDDTDYETHLLSGENVLASRWAKAYRLLRSLASQYLRGHRSRRRSKRRRAGAFLCRSAVQNFVLLSYTFLAITVALTVIGAIFFPSYTHLPPHYKQLRSRVRSSTTPGRGNPLQEKIYIAASIYDPGGSLVRGEWGRVVLELIDLLGPENVYLSIYENDSGTEARQTLSSFKSKVPCNHTLTFEEHLSMDSIRHVRLVDGTERVKRIEYLAEVRNRALRPLETAQVKFDKLLYLNDVVFHAEDVIQLLFSTNQDQDGSTNYRAACAVDFINPFKFYDTFATRDLEGYGMGVPFFPWFSAVGDSRSRQDVILGRDAVPVRSCWGGIVAFDANFFQNGGQVPDDTAGALSPKNLSAPFRFRAEEEVYWDASECCLIQADIQSTELENTGIFMNPFVRVAYDSRTLSWLAFTRRFERLYSPIHFLIDILANMPHYNPRRDEQAWQHVEETVWVPDMNSPSGGSFEVLPRIATHTGFCGKMGLAVIKETTKKGEKNWESISIS